MKNSKMKKILVSLIVMVSVFAVMTVGAFAVGIYVGGDAPANFVNAKFYVLGSSNVTTYAYASTSLPVGYIAPGDLCTVLDTSDAYYWKVSYPIPGGTKKAYCPKSAILSNTSFVSKRMYVDNNATVYRKSDMSTSFGTVYTTDTAYLLSPVSDGKAQIIYPVPGGYKIGWIYAIIRGIS